MLEKIDLSKRLPKNVYKKLLPRVQRRLYDLERGAYEAKLPTVVVFEGWDAAGKGTSINKLMERLDPRGFKLYPIQAPRTYELNHPWLWRFWLKLPNYGEMAIFDRSWYGRVMVERVEGFTPEREWRNAYRDIVDFERTIADDRYKIVKFWLHISKAEQERRFKLLEKDSLKSWHVQPEDWEHHRKYDQYVLAVEEMLERTETEWGPWTIVEATDRYFCRIKIFDTVIRAMEEALDLPFTVPPEPSEAQLAFGDYHEADDEDTDELEAKVAEEMAEDD